MRLFRRKITFDQAARFNYELDSNEKLKTALKNKYVQAILGGLKPCIVDIVLATGIHMAFTNCIGSIFDVVFNCNAIIITILLIASMLGYKHFRGKKLSPIMLIVISAVSGALVYGI